MQHKSMQRLRQLQHLKGYYDKAIAFLIQTDFFNEYIYMVVVKMKAISYTWK